MNTSTATTRLELEAEELRRECDRLRREEAVWRSRAELADRKAQRCVLEAEQAQALTLQLERDVLQLRQKNQQSEIKLTRSLNDLEEQFELEREAWEQAMQSGERRLKEACRLEREQAFKAAALEKKLAVLQQQQQQSSPRKRHRTTSSDEDEDSEDGEDDSDTVFDLKLRVRELEAENGALAKGVAVTQRTQQLAEELAARDRDCRQLRDELAHFKSQRKVELEAESNAGLLQVQLQALKAKYAALAEFAAMKDSVLAELEQWKRVVPACGDDDASTPQQARQRFAEFEANYGKLSSRCAELEVQVKRLELEAAEAGRSQQQLERAAGTLQAKLDAAERQAKQMEIERDATERVLNSVSLIAAADGADDNQQQEEEETRTMLTQALHKCREELRAVQQQRDQLEREMLCSIGSHAAFDSDRTRVLHIKPQQRADTKLKAEAAAAAAAAAAAVAVPKQPMLLRTPAPAGAASASALAAMINTPEGFSVDKHNARLKEMFQKQIRLFKEAVFLLFGWKIEMTPDEQRPVLKLRSMFAESPEDVLLFRMNTSTSQLDLLGSEFAKTLDPTVLGYLHRFQSPPGFISYLTLDLFNRQTRT